MVVENELWKIWAEALTPSEREALDRGGEDLGSAFAKLDVIILKQAETLGWRITLSELVR